MQLSLFDIFKIGVGPSSSHTMGPMVAAGRFLELLLELKLKPASVGVSLHGSLAFTGKGHRSDYAAMMGLIGFRPETFDANEAAKAEARLRETNEIRPVGHPAYVFNPDADIRFDYDRVLPSHANGMVFYARDGLGQTLLEQVYYSVGGGFVMTDTEIAQPDTGREDGPALPYPFSSVAELLALCKINSLTIADIVMANEMALRPKSQVNAGIAKVWDAMNAAIDTGFATTGILPGGLNMKRRAKDIHSALVSERGANIAAPHIINDWIAAYAMAVNEENAAGARIVTAPTNGAAGVLPATLRYYLDHVPGAHSGKIPEFLLTATAIGGLIKSNASISGAEVGCQGEVGSASAMAAAGLCAVLGGAPNQIENAAEIALEHHLGMTCDPIKGLVQAPCIERNGLGAIKAVSAASLALRGDGTHIVSLDACIETMRQTGRDMDEKYKETSLGGLAVNVPEC